MCYPIFHRAPLGMETRSLQRPSTGSPSALNSLGCKVGEELGRQDSNLRMRVPKTRVLPLDDAPSPLMQGVPLLCHFVGHGRCLNPRSGELVTRTYRRVNQRIRRRGLSRNLGLIDRAEAILKDIFDHLPRTLTARRLALHG